MRYELTDYEWAAIRLAAVTKILGCISGVIQWHVVLPGS